LDGVDTVSNRAFSGMTCQAALSREEYPPALPQLVAIDDCALSARHVVEDAALDKRVYARVAEQDQRPYVIGASPRQAKQYRQSIHPRTY
jgi:hypothetical protein